MLSLSQPAVTKLLRALEDETSLALFDRSGRRLVPTHEARRFEAEVELLFVAARRVDRLANDMRNADMGELRVAAMPSLGIAFLPKLLARFSRRSGDTRVSITVASSLEVQDLVQAGQADLGFALPVASLAMPVAAPPLVLRAVLALPPGHVLAARSRIDLADLEGERCILVGRQYRLGDCVEDLFHRQGVRPHCVAETQNASAACTMVEAGLGVAVVNPVTAHEFVGRIVVRPLEPTVEFPVQTLAPPDRPMSQLAGHFLTMLRGELGALGCLAETRTS